MALRKQHFDSDNEHLNSTPKRTRITFDVSPGLRRRIKTAASQQDLSIGEYLGRILDQVVPAEADTTQYSHPLNRETLKRMLQVREEIMQHTHGRIFEDSTEMIRQMRDERSRELEQL
jgi:hypothetical protein